MTFNRWTIKYSGVKKVTAFWLLLALLWFNSAASLMHTCNTGRGLESECISQCGSSCLVCDWQATEKPLPSKPVTTQIIGELTEQLFPGLSKTAPVTISVRAAARAPPSFPLA